MNFYLNVFCIACQTAVPNILVFSLYEVLDPMNRFRVVSEDTVDDDGADGGVNIKVPVLSSSYS